MRPAYHYAPAANWLSDPNGLIWWRGEWHLFYQYNPQGEDWGHMAWGHAVSPDLAVWHELPPALVEDAQHMIFSGSAVIDAQGSAGFGSDAMIAIYTGAGSAAKPQQVQCLAHSQDRGRSWTKFAGNPVLDLGLADFRDPNVFWHEPGQQWIMVTVFSDRNCAMLHGSANLKDWHTLSRIETSGAPGHLWECPLLIELPVEGTKEQRWLFKVDVLSGAPGSGALYRTGTFDGQRFTPDPGEWQLVDGGSDFYAAIAWHEPRDACGRPLWIGWMGNHAYQARLPRQGWRGAMSMPRRISLRQTADGYRLVQRVEPAAVRGVCQFGAGGAVLPISTALALPETGHWSVRLSDSSGRYIQLGQDDHWLTIQRRDPVTPQLDRHWVIDVAPGTVLDAWIDHGSLELLSKDGLIAIAMQHRFNGDRIAADWG